MILPSLSKGAYVYTYKIKVNLLEKEALSYRLMIWSFTLGLTQMIISVVCLVYKSKA